MESAVSCRAKPRDQLSFETFDSALNAYEVDGPPVLGSPATATGSYCFSSEYSASMFAFARIACGASYVLYFAGVLYAAAASSGLLPAFI